ncbi:cytochrome ubiquinol oxidase subunit I [Aeromicrobium sp. UC242_57]|uniref:cytochrome ubiquinol oxidase subunit I n=1 Tax=Aeromicrobium sp. UC242_57 TaxID=3374624 RepID=UPI0037901E44
MQAEYQERFGPGDYTPNIPVTYWTFRLMITAGGIAMAMGALMLWVTRRDRTPTSKWFLRGAIVLPLLPLVANSFGWIFTEMGRQPWVVFGLMKTSAGVSPSTSVAEVATSLIGFTLLYGVLAIIEVKLLLRYVKKGLPELEPPHDPDDVDAPLAYAY